MEEARAAIISEDEEFLIAEHEPLNNPLGFRLKMPNLNPGQIDEDALDPPAGQGPLPCGPVQALAV